MGEVAIVYKIIPEPEKREEIKNKLTEAGAKEIKEEEIGFGITAFKVAFVMQDEPGKVEELEAKIESIEGVNSIQVEGTSLL
jgi:translation elongation factor EF-1beta